MQSERLRTPLPLAWALVFAPLLFAGLHITALGYRSDYVGHALAGFGGTLGALALLLLISASTIPKKRVLPLALLAYACVALGVRAEATVFKISIFDPMDLALQSCGALLAGAIGLAVNSRSSGIGLPLVMGFEGFLFLMVGVRYALH